ncbi:MAG: hypothetical protein U0359_10295 [Byssovorax sp.]
MYHPLIPCPSCQRHVRAGEIACPFCASPLADGAPRPAVDPVPRMSRAAAFVFGATLAVTGCEAEIIDPQSTGATSTGTGAGAGGADGGSGLGGAKPDGGPEDDGGVQALYGDPPPPVDAGKDGPDDDGGGFAKYGAPPPPMDAGDDAPSDGGGGQPIYGSPPPPPPKSNG